RSEQQIPLIPAPAGIQVPQSVALGPAFAGTNGVSNKLRSFPRKRESRGRSQWPWIPASAGTNGEQFAGTNGEEFARRLSRLNGIAARDAHHPRWRSTISIVSS